VIAVSSQPAANEPRARMMPPGESVSSWSARRSGCARSVHHAGVTYDERPIAGAHAPGEVAQRRIDPRAERVPRFAASAV